MSARFNRRQIVWAKIEPYPWWPGKIINIHIQSNEIVYKILFFADPTYAYLQQKQLIAHGEFDRTLNIRFGYDSRLHKASKMADEAYSKMHHQQESREGSLDLALSKISSKSTKQSIFRPSSNQQEVVLDGNLNQQRIEEVQRENQGGREVADLIKMEETSITPVEKELADSNSLFIKMRQITPENIFQILQGRSRAQQSQSYNYQNRKEVIRYTFQLKTKLLERFNLLHINQEEYSGRNKKRSQIAQEARKILKNKRDIKREKIQRKNIGSGSSSIVRQKCMRKLYTILKKSHNPSHSGNHLRQFIVSAMSRISRCSQQNQLKYQTLFMSIVKLISEQSRNRCLGEHMINVQNYLDRIQNEKHEDEQGSKMTQLSVPIH